MGDKQVRVMFIGNPGPRDKWLFDKFKESLIGKELVIDFTPVEKRAAEVFRNIDHDLIVIDEIVDKPTKKEVGTYAAMFGVPKKTYTPLHKRKGKRK
uniref:Uncharacterized protein n=1 Tax=Salmonella phage vB_SEnST11_KE24 TaxID=3161175 RepID=A0AAU8GGU4_9CAUD